MPSHFTGVGRDSAFSPLYVAAGRDYREWTLGGDGLANRRNVILRPWSAPILDI